MSRMVSGASRTLVIVFAITLTVEAQKATPAQSEQGLRPVVEQLQRQDDALQKIAAELRNTREQQERLALQLRPQTSPPIYSNWVLIVVTLGAVLAAYKTLREMRKQVDAGIVAAEAAKQSAETAKQALHLAESPDLQVAQIIVETPPGRPPTVVSTDCKIILEIRNFGRTRAVAVSGHWKFGIPGLTEKETKKTGAPIVVSANGAAYLTLGLIGDVCSSDQWEEVRHGRMPLRFWGQESYCDVFGHAHVTHAEGTYQPPNGFSIDKTEAS